MVKKIENLNKDYIILIVIIILIIIVLYSIYIYNKTQKNIKESFYQNRYSNIRQLHINQGSFENFTNTKSLHKFELHQDIIYIYTTKKENVNYNYSHNSLKDNMIPISGIPSFSSIKYNYNNGFSKSIKLPSPTTVNGKFFDYIISVLTNIKNINYYTKDYAENDIDPCFRKKYHYNNAFRSKINITDNDFINIMKEFFKVLVACNNNTTLKFIRYYKKDNVIYNSSTKNVEFTEINEDELEEQIYRKNVIVFFENINIIKFLQVTDQKLFDKFQEFSNSLSIKFD
jgi:hypothetical protein